MHRETLIEVGRALYGEAWIKPLCADCAWSPRFIERIRDGQNEAPPFLKAILLELLAGRMESLAKLREDATPERREKLAERVREFSAAAMKLAPEQFKTTARRAS